MFRSAHARAPAQPVAVKGNQLEPRTRAGRGPKGKIERAPEISRRFPRAGLRTAFFVLSRYSVGGFFRGMPSCTPAARRRRGSTPAECLTGRHRRRRTQQRRRCACCRRQRLAGRPRPAARSIDRLQIGSERLRRGGAARIVLTQEVRQRPTEPVLGEAARTAMAGRAVGRKQFRAGLASIEILRPCRPARQRHDEDDKRKQPARLK